MRLVSRIRHYFNKKALNKQVRPLKRAVLNKEEVKWIGILFDATDPAETQEVLQYKKQLQKQGKKVRLLAYINSRSKEIEASFPFFLRSDLSWKSIPQHTAVEHFLTTSLDLLMVLTPTSNLAFEYISSLSDARLKMGPYSKDVNSYDFMLEISKQTSPMQMAATMETYLQLMQSEKIKHNQLATA